MTTTAGDSRTAEQQLTLDPLGRELLFTAARTANTFSDEPVSDEQLREITELAKWPPTMANTNPLIDPGRRSSSSTSVVPGPTRGLTACRGWRMGTTSSTSEPRRPSGA